MRSIDSWLDRFAYRHPKFGIPNLMYFIIAGNVLVFLLDQFSSGTFSILLDFYPGAVLQGQIWRLLTFIFIPTTDRLIWFILSMFFYAFLGPFMEREWGTAKFTLFYLCGVLLNIVFGFVSYFLSGLEGFPMASMYYVNLSLFLAFATLYPDIPLRFYFVIPIRAKWLALLYLFLMAWDVIGTPTALLPLILPIRLPSILASLVNYVIFFWTYLSPLIFRVKHQTSRQTINFKKATRDAKKEKGYLHKCAVCGITDADDPNMEFRYCSKCSGYYCYCMDHINNHVHIQ